MKTVFVVNDDKNLVRVMARTLETLLDVEVQVFTDPILALGAATEHRPDAMVVDMMMPGADGISLSRELRRQGVDSPIVIMTAYMPLALDRLLPTNNVRAILNKVDGFQALAQAVKGCLEGMLCPT